jgi:uncharacterized protein YndB with AHSA1/START domain
MTVRYRRRYNKPVAAVWAAVTIPERLADWLAVADIELRQGGRIHLTWNNTNSMEGTVTVCDPPNALAWVWPLSGRDTLVRFDLEPDGTGCLLTLTHSGLPTTGPATGVRAGWHAHLEALPEAMEERRTAWSVKTAREAALATRYAAVPA